MAFSELVRAWREGRGLTLEAAARVLGVPYRTLQDWQAGRRAPKGLAARLIRKHLAVDELRHDAKKTKGTRCEK